MKSIMPISAVTQKVYGCNITDVDVMLNTRKLLTVRSEIRQTHVGSQHKRLNHSCIGTLQLLDHSLESRHIDSYHCIQRHIVRSGKLRTVASTASNHCQHSDDYDY